MDINVTKLVTFLITLGQRILGKSELLELGRIFQKHKVVDKYMIGLLHKHYDLTQGKIAVTTEITPDVTITKATAVSSLGHRSLRGQLYFLHNDEWQAYEYEDGVTEGFNPNFLRELADKIRVMGLDDRVSLGSSKKSLGTREMLIAHDATASFTSSSLGDSWESLDVKVLEVGWGFITIADGPDAIVLEGYTGHASSTSSGNHVVPYTTNNCSYSTGGLLEKLDLENSSDILRELKMQGWLKE